MAHKLKTIEFDDGRRLFEKACENYCCSSCGCKMISCNFVNGVCIQVFASHKEHCSIFPGNAFEKTREINCSTCKYYDESLSCTYAGETDSRIDSVRTTIDQTVTL